MKAAADWLGTWLRTRITIRDCGRSFDVDDLVHRPALSLPMPLTVVTAWNPMAIDRDRQVNRAANRQLRHLLDERGLEWRPAVGRSSNGTWSEPGFAVAGLTPLEAAALGRELQQLAVFYVRGSEVQVLGSDGSLAGSRSRG